MEDFRIYVGDIVYFNDSDTENMLCRISKNKLKLIDMKTGNRYADVKFRIRNEYVGLIDYPVPYYINLSEINVINDIDGKENPDVFVTKVTRKGEIVYLNHDDRGMEDE